MNEQASLFGEPEPVKRTPLKRKPPPPRPPEGPMEPDQWYIDAIKRTRSRCEVSGVRLRDWMLEVHHVLPKGLLRARGLHQYVWHPDNAMVVDQRIHARHTNATRRIDREKIRQATWDFCRMLDKLDGTEWATAYLERTYPEGGLADE